MSVKEKRGSFLSVLCVLSWVNIGYLFLTNSVTLLGGRLDEDQLDAQRVQWIELYDSIETDGAEAFKEMIKEQIATGRIINEYFYFYHGGKLLFLSLGAIAVFSMFRLKRQGYSLYVAYSLLYAFLPYYVTRGTLIAMANLLLILVIAGLFMLLYGLQLKRMN